MREISKSLGIGIDLNKPELRENMIKYINLTIHGDDELINQRKPDPGQVALEEAKKALRKKCVEAAEAHQRRVEAAREGHGLREAVSVPVLLPSKFDCEWRQALPGRRRHAPTPLP